jgi:DNA-binding transcriptional ArsR family regulator
MDTLQVVAEPRRREILSLIWDDELAASEIAAEFEVTFGAVSQHLAVLREAELVTVRKEGNRRLYMADRAALAPYRGILESMWSDTLGRLASTIEERSTQ